MNINTPTPEHIPALRALWKQAFGDADAFLDDFFTLAFSPDRCRCIEIDGQFAAMLYWFDCEYSGQKIAYLYAVATDEAFRNQGLCRTLMENTHAYLKQSGYHSAMLVPGNRELFRFYEKLGYQTVTYIREFTCRAGFDPIALRKIDAAAYAAQRRQLLPTGSVIQEGPALTILESQSGFFAGEGLLLTATLAEDKLLCCELLGPEGAAPDILAALGAAEGRFRTPGSEKPFAMYFPLASNALAPAYFGLALD